MEQQPLVSVIVPVYNAGAHLLPCLASIAAQSLQQLEVILVENGSSDDSAAQCRQFIQQDHRFKLLILPEPDVTQARRAGLEASCAPWVSFVDCDDLLHPQMLQSLLEGCISTGLPVACCRLAPFWGQPPQAQPIAAAPQVLAAPQHQIALLQSKAVEYSLCNKLYARCLLQRVEFTCPAASNEDLYLNWLLFGLSPGLAQLDFVGYFYRQHNASASHRPLTGQVIQQQLLVASNIAQSAQNSPGSSLQTAAQAFYYEKLLYLNSMILRQKNPAPLASQHKELVGLARQQLGAALGNASLSPTMKCTALLTCWGGIFYRLLCRLMLRDRR